MQLRKEQLFKGLLSKFEDFEIIDVWQEFIGETIPLLENLTNISRILFNRYYDEYEKELTGKRDEKVKKDLLGKIKELILTQMENNVLTDQYLYLSKISNIDLDYKTYLASYVENELQKKFIEELFFHSKLPNTMMDDVAEFMREHYKSNKYDEILRNLSEQVDLLEANEDLVIERNNNKGHYYAYQLSKTLKKIEKDWWWEDTEVFRAVYNQAAGYYTNLLDLQIDSNLRSEIENVHHPLSHANAIFYKCKFYYKMGIHTSVDGIHKQSGRYFSGLLELAEKGLVYVNKIKNNKNREILGKFERLINKTELLQYNINLSTQFSKLFKMVEKGDTAEISKLLKIINGFVDSFVQKVEIKYLSALPTLYESLISTVDLLLNMNKSSSEIADVINRRLKSFAHRIEVATNQLVDELQRMENNEGVSETKIKVMQILSDVEILIETISMIPIHIIERITTIKRLQTIQSLVLSISEDIKAYENKNKNIMRVLIHKSKANFHAEFAKNMLDSVNSDSLPVERIHAQFNGSLVSGYMNEINLFQLCLQYLCINEILPNLISTFANQANIKDHTVLMEELWNDQLFRNLLSQVRRDCDILLEHKQSIISYPIRGVQWGDITQKRNASTAIASFYESIKFAMIASIASSNERYDDAHQLFIAAQDMAFDSATHFQQVQTPEFTDYGTHIFSFGQFTQDSANKTKMREKIRLPVQELIKLFRDILFNL